MKAQENALQRSIERLKFEGFVIDGKSEAQQRGQCVIALLELAAEKAQESGNFPEPIETMSPALYHTSKTT